MEALLPPPWRYFARREIGKREILRWGWCWREQDLEHVRNDLDQFDLWVQFHRSVGNAPRPTKEFITAWRGFFIDIDPIDPQPAIWYAKSAIVLALQDALGGRPEYAAVYTGRGLQLWVPSLEIDTDGTMDGLERAVHELLTHLDHVAGNGRHGIKIDVSVADRTRLARLPFTINQRTGARGYVERVAGDFTKNDINLNLGMILLKRWYHEPPRPPASPTKPGRPWGAVVHRLSELAADFLTEGVPKGDRHRAACAAAYGLREQGCAEASVWDALSTGNDLCDPPLEEPELRRVLRSTRKAR